MNSRQRVITALEHQEPDRVPFDCTFTYDVYRKLESALGIPQDQKLKPRSPALSVSPSMQMLHEMKIDLVYMGLNPWKNEPEFQYGLSNYTDIWGVGYKKIEGSAGPEYFNDFHPLAIANQSDLEKFPWPDPNASELTTGLRERAEDLYKNTEFALVGKFSTSIFEQAAALRGMEQLYIDFIQNPAFIDDLFNRLTNIAIQLNEAGLRSCGQYLQILRLAGDDMGSQRGPLLNPKMFRKMVKPYFARLYSHAKNLFQKFNPNGKLMAHTDGDVYPIIPDYCEMGLDVLNPVQPKVAEMDHARLKQEFGSQLSFHGGIDIQYVMPFGSVEEVAQEVREKIQNLGKGGGYILAPTHYILPDVPTKNLIALRDAVTRWGSYPLV